MRTRRWLIGPERSIAFHLLRREPARWTRTDRPRVRPRRVRSGWRERLAGKAGHFTKPRRRRETNLEKARAAGQEAVLVTILILCLLLLMSLR